MAPPACHIAGLNPTPAFAVGGGRLARACVAGSAAAVLAACGGPVAPQRAAVATVAGGEYRMDQLPGGAVRIARVSGSPLTYSDGLPARRAADALCGPQGVASSTRDRFDNGAWVFPGGCA